MQECIHIYRIIETDGSSEKRIWFLSKKTIIMMPNFNSLLFYKMKRIRTVLKRRRKNREQEQEEEEENTQNDSNNKKDKKIK